MKANLQYIPDILIQAKALILGGLPYEAVKEQQLTREVSIGKETTLRITYTAVGKKAELPYGSDRALLAWIQTQAYPSGVAKWDSIREFLSAFDLADSGQNYAMFYQRIDRIKRLHIQIEIIGVSGELVLNTAPIEASYTPRSPEEIKSLVRDEEVGQLSLMQETRYGFKLNKSFMTYFNENFVVLPLPLMKEFHNAPKQWDFAQFAVWRCAVAQSPSLVPFDELLLQLGATEMQIQESKNFRAKQKYALNKVLDRIREQYPTFPAHFVKGYGGLRVYPWTPPKNLN